MPSFANSALRLLRQILGPPSRTRGAYVGTPTALDGNTAVAVTEATIGEGAGLCASLPAETAALSWRAEQQRLGVNLMGEPLVGCVAESPRGALSAAIGLSLSGIRATAFLSGPDLASARDLLSSAAGRRLPLVMHLGNRALASQAAALGSGHEACHLSADSGCFMLFAANVQEAVDFALVARRTAERALVPGLVIMDGEQTALAIQEVRLPPGELVKKYLGAPADDIQAPTPAQKLLFGEHRRRVPRWHDPDRPVLQGGLQPAAVWGLGKAANRAFVDTHLEEMLDESFRQFAQHTGREHQAVSAHRVDDARLVLVAQGATIETAEAAADQVRGAHKLKVGVLGVRSLRPFPGRRIADLLRKKQITCVLERLDTPLAGDPPLLRELRAALDCARENDRFGTDTHPGYPAMVAADCPRCLSIVYGLGGLPLRGADLVALCTGADEIKNPQIYLGITFARSSSLYPKRQVLLDRLRREYPAIASLGLTGGPISPDLRPAEAITLAVQRLSGQGGEGLALEAASFLHRVAGGQLRSRPALFAEPWGSPCIDYVTSAPKGLRDPGDQAPVDLAVLVAGAPSPAVLADLRDGGTLLLEGSESGEELPPDTISSLRNGGAKLYRVPRFDRLPAAETASADSRNDHSRNDYLLGAIFGVMLNAGLLEVKARRLLANRDEALGHLPEARRTARMDAFKTGFEGIRELDPARLKSALSTAAPAVDEAPMVVRELGNIDDLYDSLPRFWDQVGVLYRNGEVGELTPDPYLAIGAIPPLSSAFRDLSPLRADLPVLNPAACTGCGNCWSSCPEAAIGAVALTPGSLIDAAIDNTAGADALRPMASKLAARLTTLCGNQDFAPTTLNAPLQEAFAWLQEKMAPPAERKRALQAAFGKLEAGLACLQPAVTETFFRQPESRQKAGGELLFPAVNPDACKACGICVAACEPGALDSVSQTGNSLADARKLWLAWEQLPDTRPASVARIGGDPSVNALAAALLARRGAGTLAGGDGAEPGSGERLALRLAMDAAESLHQPLIRDFIEEVRGVREKLTDLIRDTLAGALPADDLDALARGLATVDTRQAELSALIDETRNSIDSGVDAVRLRRLVDLARNLGDLDWRLSEGRQGFGRARMGLVLSAGSISGWAGVFPNNPFRAPVALDPTGDGAQLAAGLLEGQLRQSTQGYILMRKARLELERPNDAVRMGSDLDRLTWRDLTPDERALCPAMLVVGSAGVLGGQGLSQMAWLLGTDLPIKLVLLADLDLGLSNRAALETPLAAGADPGIDIALLALARRSACIAQTSLGAPDHLMHSLLAAFGFQGPALLHLHAPSPARHGFASDRTLEQARLATEARAFPLFIYDPEAEGVFGARLSLDDNPQPLDAWTRDGAGEALTPASWAITESRFAACFSPLTSDAPEPLELEEYLALEESARGGKTPFVSREQNGERVRFAVDPGLVRVCMERLQAWRTLQELAGLVTPFTASVKRDAA
ncbi:MAG: 4Fe-4S binding protein [Pseudomonadota bacterium]|nr:4Fe-4S binding protein [Pseudomonadota bacterium]